MQKKLFIIQLFTTIPTRKHRNLFLSNYKNKRKPKTVNASQQPRGNSQLPFDSKMASEATPVTSLILPVLIRPILSQVRYPTK